ncbi:helix-turn-helix transcriptional regulator [Paenibacillus provencensis]|uniref:Helix-turn-helix transcriptional regulator n=1 Tax=Paenibacillus provencensis TaxID=441151 RepID=A0ABW3Q1J9_9BACL|nr:helix-turn-helix transcriptional regulator [Paenibacillus sp. MER 78]
MMLNYLIPRPQTISILHEVSNEFYFQGSGRLSLKTFSNGRALYETGQGTYAVEEEKYLLLNQGQEYSITIESREPVESFCVFITEEGIEDLKRTLMLPPELLLEDPFDSGDGTTSFMEKTYTNQHMSILLKRLKGAYVHFRHDPVWMEERLHELGSVLLKDHQKVHYERQRLTSIKSSTRAELYRRVQIGHEYLSAYFNRQIIIQDAAVAACMSGNHFLRSYKQLFGRSPHQYLTERRLQEARKMLRTTNLTVTEICMEVGIQSPSSFSLLFSKWYGISPIAFRQKK